MKEGMKQIMNKELFYKACKQITTIKRNKNSIGTQKEKSVHAILKNYFEPNEKYQEIRVEHYIADIKNESEIIEIQTRGFNKLRQKLEVFLKKGLVTIVYPVPLIKWIYWIDKNTGEISKKRKSPKKGSLYEIFYELYKIKSFLLNDNLRFCIVLLELEEFRYLDGHSKDKKKGSTKLDKIPIQLIDEITIHNRNDYKKFIPTQLPIEFTSKDYQYYTGISLKLAQITIHILNYMGVIKKIGKQGNLIKYQLI